MLASDRWLHLISSGPLWSVVIFSSVLGLIALGFARCSNDTPLRRNAVKSKATEKAALQEYFQTHSIRPANLAEMVLLEAERRRRINENRN